MSRPLRIAFVPAARLLSERAPNGEALIATAIMRGLAERGHEILAYCERNEWDPPSGIEVREVVADGVTAAMTRIRFARRIARDVARERVDLAHLLFPFTTHEGYALVRGVPLVAGPINLPWPASPVKARLAARLAATYTGPRERRYHDATLARASRLLVTGDSSRAGLPASLAARIDEVPFGVDTDRFTPAPMPEEPRILFLSVLQERKGIDTLIRAMPHVLRRIPRARLVVAGDDPMVLRPRLEALAADLGVGDAVTFAGAVDRANVPFAYANARVVAQPSHGEPFGMTVIEAMACGRPVVGTAAGGIPDAVVEGKGGRLVPAGDPRMLADGLCSVLAHPGTAEAMGAFNRQRALERYALSHIIDRIDQTYRRLAADREAAHVA